MTPQELKESIIRLAMKGKLTSQLESDGNSADYLASIMSYKKTNKIADNKKMLPVSEEDIPFDIPESWKWVRFGSIVNYRMGKTPPRAESQWWGSDVNWVSIADMPESGHITSTKEKVSNTAIGSIFGGRLSQAGTLLMSFKLTVGRVSILDIDAIHNEAIISIFPYCDSEGIVQSYLFQLLPIISQYGDSKNAIKGKTLNDTSICNLMIPLPPLAEQKRIVAKIEELLPLIERYEQAWTKLEAFNKRFPNDMQKSVLQMAIQGKLVEQRPEEGTGEELYRQIQAEKQSLIKDGKIKREKPLPEISEDEIPFDIPDSWKWVYIGDLFYHNTGKALNSSNKDGLLYTYITTSNVYWNHFELDNLKSMLFTESELDKCTVFKGELLVLEGGEVGRAAIWNYDFPMRIQNHIHRLKRYYPICVKYFYYIFYLYKKSGKINGKGIGIKGLSSKALHSLVVPPPPLAEQNRIVQKLDEILPLCEKLKGGEMY